MKQRLRSLEKALARSFAVSASDIERMIGHFHRDMQRGLRGRASSLKMLPAYVDTPSGNERGDFIALDLGGTNFRVLLVKLGGGRARIMHTAKYVIPRAVMHGTGIQMFNFIAEKIKSFADDRKLDFGVRRELGFTFSFPMKQTDIARGLLINWTKGFTASGVVGKDVVRFLRQSLERCGIENIDVVALANDTVGTLAAKAYADPRCDIGVIFGTGTNACYRERTRAIRGLPRKASRTDHMVVNIEWGNFDKLPFTTYDEKLDSASNNPGCQRMEKMISGMYLGEAARLVLTDLMRHKMIFAACKGTFAAGDFTTRQMAAIEADRTKQLAKIKAYLEGVGMLGSTREDRLFLRNICTMISTRAARISAAALAAVVTWTDPALTGRHTIGIDGTIYEKYPGFRRRILSTLREIHGDKAGRLKLARAKDGSGIGVVVVAAAAAASRER